MVLLHGAAAWFCMISFSHSLGVDRPRHDPRHDNPGHDNPGRARQPRVSLSPRRKQQTENRAWHAPGGHSVAVDQLAHCRPRNWLCTGAGVRLWWMMPSRVTSTRRAHAGCAAVCGIIAWCLLRVAVRHLARLARATQGPGLNARLVPLFLFVGLTFASPSPHLRLTFAVSPPSLRRTCRRFG